MVRVPMGRSIIGKSTLYSSVVAIVLIFCAPAHVSASGLAGANSSPPSASELSEANSPTSNNRSARNATIRRNQSSEAAVPNAIKPQQNNNLRANSNNGNKETVVPVVARASSRPAQATQSSASVNSPNQASRPKANETVSIATEAEMALALNMPLEPKSAKDAQFVTNDMRPMDVAPWQKIGSPYQVNGVWYIPAHEPDYDETGEASWYGNQFNGRPTANGEIFDMNAVTVAHPTLPIPSLVEVINLENGRSIVARVNDRGPFAHNRLIDVSQRGAELLGFKDKGRARVRVRYVGQAPQQTINANAAPPRVQTTANTSAPLAPAEVPKAQPAPTSIASSVQVASKSQTPNEVRASNNNGSYVQIGAFSSEANARRVLDQNSSFGPGKIIPVANGETSIFRVMIGPFDPTDAALKAQEAKSNGISGARVVANIS